MKALKAKGVEAKFPLFKKIHEIAFEGAEPKSLLDVGNSTKYYQMWHVTADGSSLMKEAAEQQ